MFLEAPLAGKHLKLIKKSTKAALAKKWSRAIERALPDID
jgi:hypothetical protein